MKNQALSQLIPVLQYLRDEIDAELPMQAAMVYLTVASNPGVTMKELQEAVGISQASCSRNVAALSAFHRLNKPGYNVVVATEDPLERRRKVVRLTEKGQRIANGLSSLVRQVSVNVLAAS